ncbi:hypothetical protein VTK26DRAFT_2936 [Humicola hyalothermophila]
MPSPWGMDLGSADFAWSTENRSTLVVCLSTVDGHHEDGTCPSGDALPSVASPRPPRQLTVLSPPAQVIQLPALRYRESQVPTEPRPLCRLFC